MRPALLIANVRPPMICACLKLPDSFYLEEAPQGFEAALEHKETSVRNWRNLAACRCCGTLWAVDEWDKGQSQVVSRVHDVAHWDAHSEKESKALLLRSRGGLTDERCVWAGCEKNKVRGAAYCIDHLYATGARK